MNQPIPTMPCFACGKLTNETQSIFGVGHMKCYKEKPRGTLSLVAESLKVNQ